MLGEAERRKSEILQRVVELARTRLSGAKGAAAAAFVERYYANVAAEDRIESLYEHNVSKAALARALGVAETSYREFLRGRP